MFERYTERARRVIFFARYEASQLGSRTIETEHLLLGLIRENNGLTGHLLGRSKIEPDEIRSEIEARTRVREKISTSVEIPLSVESKRVLAYAAEEAEKMFHKYIGTEHILLGLLREKKALASRILLEKGMRLTTAREDLLYLLKEETLSEKKKDTPFLSEFSRDLTELAAQKVLDPLIGREQELKRIIQILCRRTKNNPVLIGEPGVGKTALVEGLAQKIVVGDVPRFLHGKRILALDISSVVAGTKYRGQFEERLKSIIKELDANKDILVFIDELHTLVGAGSAEGSLDAAGILKPALSRGELQCLGSTTPKEHRKHIEKDRALSRRFQGVKISPPTEDETLRIIYGIRDRYEKYHGVVYNDEAIQSSVYQSNRYISDRFLPDKAIDVLDEAGARVKLASAAAPEQLLEIETKLQSIAEQVDAAINEKEFEKAAYYRDQEQQERERLDTLRARLANEESESTPPVVSKEDVDRVVSNWTGIPVSAIQEEELHKLLNMEAELHKRIVAQEPAVEVVSRAIRRARAGLKDPKRPMGSFLFLGPTGVGKTEVARTLAGFMFGDENALVRFDMSEYMEKHSVSKLIGSPPGYVGHEEGGQLTDRIKRKPYSIVLLDEIEKAHPSIFNVLLQVYEDGHLTDSLNNTVDFKNCILIMTSNVGARYIQRRGGLGFRSGDENAGYDEMRARVLEEVKRTFNPEFLNRINETIVFHSLTDEHLVEIVRLMVKDVNLNLSEKNIQVELDDQAYRWIVGQTCADRSYGARPLRRAIQKHIEDPLAEQLIRGKIGTGDRVGITVSDSDLLLHVYKPEEEGQPVAK
ncbi:MAG: ATP-dependent Clp protease ATP-binding subunit ClpC [Acidobacteria bacterium]|jgi:ATP-dependent Clp protease ATP-binding subunit ClpC|nr:ATP-dependent Clp protease ATP-binding subunit ClpC [Acidobacteriota bacterium]|tara:strand:- start:14558 stop:17002 length:2445 start_codon:yes stop_codon:yes gene_type:complete